MEDKAVQSANKKSILQRMGDHWPSSVVAIQEVGRFTGGAMSPKYLANLLSAGQGPPSTKLGRKRIIEVTAFISWLEARVES